MRDRVLTLILIFSLAFNIAFVGMWIYNITQATQGEVGEGSSGVGIARQRRTSPWQELGLSEEQEDKPGDTPQGRRTPGRIGTSARTSVRTDGHGARR
jgi:hypothetical protein